MTQATSADQSKLDHAAIRIRLETELRTHDVYKVVTPPASDDPRPGCTNHVADSASVAEVQFTNDALRSTMGRIGLQVLRALQKLEQGTYGLCDVCQGEIEPDRLEALFYASTCKKCMGLNRN
jgi:RNA polymerase-binding transcription factor DksA